MPSFGKTRPDGNGKPRSHALAGKHKAKKHLTAAEIEGVVAKWRNYFADLLQVQAWKVDIKTSADEELIDSDSMACVYLKPDYEKATIYIRPEWHPDAAEVLDSLRHELIHIVLAPMDTYQKLIQAYLPTDAARAVESRAFTTANEHCVLNIERLLTHGVYPLLRQPPDAAKDTP